MKVRLTHMVLVAIASVALVGMGCAGSDSGSKRPEDCYGKCDGPPTGYVSPYEADLAKLNQQWSGPTVEKIEDAFSVIVDLGEIKFAAPTHLFGVPVNVIPYSNEDDVVDAEGAPYPRGDAEIAQLFPPGAVGYAIKHHRPEHRTLDVAGMQGNMKEHMKLQDTHIEIVVGVWRDAQPGAITVNNPQGYEDGLFGSPSYPMIFVKPVFPEYVSGVQQQNYIDNIRTMMLGFNAVSDFPGSYNGGDPLAGNSPVRIREHTTQMVRAIAGDQAARDWFQEAAHQIYCAELAHVATSAGVIVPLNATTMVPEVGQETWDLFVAEINKHNNHEASAFTDLNENTRVSMIEATLAPEDLLPIAEYASADLQADERLKIAFKAMTMADIVQQFMRTHVPREQLGEDLAPAQGALLQQMKPGLLEAMGMDQIPTDDPRRQAVDALFDQLVQVVATRYDSYADFQNALDPLMAQARMMTGPRDDTGTGLFVPPSLLHVITQGKHPGGLMGLQYVGHGLHVSMVKKKANPDPTDVPTPDPVVEPDEPFGSTCSASCGGFAPDLECACDEVCIQYGDCCDDYTQFCQ